MHYAAAWPQDIAHSRSYLTYTFNFAGEGCRALIVPASAKGYGSFDVRGQLLQNRVDPSDRRLLPGGGFCFSLIELRHSISHLVHIIPDGNDLVRVSVPA